MFKFRLLLWMVFFLFIFAACTQSDSNEESTVVEATQPAATAVAAEPAVAATETPAEVESDADTLDEFVAGLQATVINQVYSAMQALMDDPIAVGGWRSEWRMYEPAQTVAEFQKGACRCLRWCSSLA